MAAVLALLCLPVGWPTTLQGRWAMAAHAASQARRPSRSLF